MPVGDLEPGRFNGGRTALDLEEIGARFFGAVKPTKDGGCYFVSSKPRPLGEPSGLSVGSLLCLAPPYSGIG